MLKSVINSKISSACYPGGKLSSYSIKILKKLQIQCSFIDNFKRNKLYTKKQLSSCTGKKIYKINLNK